MCEQVFLLYSHNILLYEYQIIEKLTFKTQSLIDWLLFDRVAKKYKFYTFILIWKIIEKFSIYFLYIYVP